MNFNTWALRRKIYAGVCFIIVATILSGAGVVYDLYTAVLSDHKLMVRHLTDQAYSLLESHQKQVEEKRISKEDAQKEVKEIVRQMRYQDNANYIFIYQNTMALVAPFTPEIEGTDRGHLKGIRDLNEASKNPEGGYVRYSIQKAGKGDPIPKIS